GGWPMLACGARLGDFEIVRLLNAGGMGEVYEALQRHPQRPVALKVLKPGLADNARARDRFHREAEVPGRLDHPNNVPILATARTDDGRAYYAMRLVHGLSLAELMQRAAEGDLPAPGGPGRTDTRPPVPLDKAITRTDAPALPPPSSPPALADY